MLGNRPSTPRKSTTSRKELTAKAELLDSASLELAAVGRSTFRNADRYPLIP
jgi:hypothetical protein